MNPMRMRPFARSAGVMWIALALLAGVCAAQTADAPEQEPAAEPAPAEQALAESAEPTEEVPRIVSLVRSWIPDALEGRFFLGIELWQWVGLLVVLFAAVLVDFFLRLVIAGPIRRVMARWLTGPDPAYLRWAVRPIGLLIAALVYLVLLHGLGLEDTPAIVLGTAGKLVLIAGIEFAFPSRTLYLASDRKRGLAMQTSGRGLGQNGGDGPGSIPESEPGAG